MKNLKMQIQEIKTCKCNYTTLVSIDVSEEQICGKKDGANLNLHLNGVSRQKYPRKGEWRCSLCGNTNYVRVDFDETGNPIVL